MSARRPKEEGRCRPSFILTVLAICCIGVLAAASSADRVVPTSQQASDYDIVWADASAPAESQAVYQTSNLGQNLNAYFRVTGVTLMPRNGGRSWDLGLDVASYGVAGTVQRLGGASMTPKGSEIEYSFSGTPLTTWFANTEAGLRQSFVLDDPGQNAANIRVDIAVSGSLRAALASDGVNFVTKEGNPVLHSSVLQASDASGRSIPVRMDVKSSNFAILVDASGASFPVRVEMQSAIVANSGDAGLGTTPGAVPEPEAAPGSPHHVGTQPGDDVASGDATGKIDFAQPTDRFLVGSIVPGGAESAGQGGILAPESSSQSMVDEVELNDTSGAAMLIASNVVVKGNLFKFGVTPGTAAGSDIDFYKFTANAGDVVYAATQTLATAGSSADTTLFLIDTNGTTVLESDLDDGSLGGTASSIAGKVLPASGTYFLRVWQGSSLTVAGTGTIRPYYLHFRLQSAASPPTPEGEVGGGLNDSVASATPLPATGWVSGTHGTSTDQDFYSVSLNAGDSVYMGLDPDPERDGTTWNPRLGFGLLGDAPASFTLDIDDANTVSPNSEAYFFTVKTAGAYFARVYTTAQSTGGATQTYTLSVSVHPATPNCTVYSSGTVNGVIGSPANGTFDFPIVVPGHPRIADLNVSISLTHALMADIDAALVSPAGNENSLFTDVGSATTANTSGGIQMDVDIDDEAALPASTSGLVERPIGWQPELSYRLAWFKGEDAGGTWILRLRDDVAANSGTLISWALTVCEPPPTTCTRAKVFSTNFESGAAGFTHSASVGTDNWALGTPTAAPIATCNSGTNCFKTNLTGVYSISSSMNLLSPTISLAGYAAPVTLNWAQKYQMESASFDTNWTEVHSMPGATNPKILFEFLDATMTDSVGNPATTINESAGWGQYSADISSYLGTSVEFRWNLTSDSSGNFAGLALDDVSVTAGCTLDTQCDDGNVCTTDTCDLASGCCFNIAANTCDDQNACTQNICNPTTGACEFPLITCNDNNTCTDDTCNPQSGCVFTPNNGNTCTDGSACTVGDHCLGGTCTPTGPLTCNDNNPCTDDTCLPASGCVFTNNNANTCTDNNACTSDRCVNGVCTSTTGQNASFNSTGVITIPVTAAPASPYPSIITVPGGTGAIISMDVVIGVSPAGYSHTYTDDVDVMLQGPTGPNVVLMSDVGGANPAVNLSITLSDSAATSLPDSTALSSGTFKPTNIGAGDVFPAPAPVSGASLLSIFNGTNPAGNWSLWVADDANIDGGSIGAWGLRLTVDCNDFNPCTTDVCDPLLGCQHTPINCDDGLGCTIDGCNPASGCTHTTDPTQCNDNDPCTVDTCNAAGQCVYTPFVCNDNNTCTDDTCVPFVGCQFTPNNGNTCTDNNGCTSDACVNGTCVGTPNVVCDDHNDCTDDACNPATGTCVFTPDNTNTCTDNNACTSDSCVNGTCVSTPRTVGGSAGPIAINDGSSTAAAAATPYPSTITIPPGDGKVLGVTVSLNGVTHTFPDDIDVLLVGPTGAQVTVMSDTGGSGDVLGVNLTFSDAAGTGLGDSTQIVSGTFKPTNFEVGDVFPAPAPVASGNVLLSVFNGTNPSGAWSLYVDDDLGGDTGSIASWSLKITVDCDDFNPCTIDTCDPATGCVHTPVVCNDGNACTTDSCDPATGTCVATPIVCNDGNNCTTDTCDPASGCVYTPVNCDDSNVCTLDACDPATGQCTHVPVDCNDNNACTNDSCIQALVAPACIVPDNGGGTVTLPPAGCDYLSPQDVHEIIDGLPPGTTIQLGAIHRDFICHVPGGGGNGVCSFPNLVDCDEAGGDLGGEKECSDSSLQLALHGTGTLAGWDRTVPLPISFETHTGPRVPGAPVQSFPTEMFRLFGQITADPDFDLLRIVAGNDFGYPSPGHTTLRQQGPNWSVDSFFDITYRIDFVGHAGGHVGGMSGSTTGTIRMQTGSGVGCTHTPVDCNDHNACTTDTCDPATGCVYAPVDCNDNNPCTDDACDPATGCTHTPHNCNDGSACTTDTCDPAVPGGCVYAPVICNDNNTCTDDSCNPASGCVYTPNNTNTCTDNNPCTVDVCTNGVCVSTGTVCDDHNPCTDDTCNPLTQGCTFTPDDTNTCSDGNACTAPDTCHAGVCGCNNSPVCSGTLNLFENTTSQTIPGGPTVVTSSITVSGVGPYLYRLRLPTFVLHANNADLDITLTSPAGTIVTITSDNGDVNDNVFNGTVWDDKADPGNQVPFPGTATTFAASNMVTDTTYTNNVAKATLTPEEPLGAFIGENPNGVWTLRVSDDTATNGGTLSKWSIETTTLGQAPLMATSTVSNTTPVAIANLATSTSTVAVSGVGTQIGRIRLTTAIRHTFIGDLDITLTSPSGTVVTVVSDAGTGSSGNDNVYNGTLWDDKADPGNQVPFSADTFAASNLITDTVTTNLVVKPTLTPEEPFAAFEGEDPNGTWTLRIFDDANGDTGSLTSWSLEVTTISCNNPCTVTCNDNNPCTDDSCDPTVGCVYTPNNNNTCSDGNVCTNPDACVNGTCVGTPISCDDGDVCTDDVCLPASGCVHNPNNAPCNDGNACTSNDHCSTGTCAPLAAENFDGVTAPALPAGWTSSVTGSGAAYATTTAFSDTVPNSAATDDPITVSNAVLDSPSIAITSAAAQLSFRNKVNLESSTVTPTTGFDGAVLEIKIGGGSFQDILAAGGSFVTGGYTHVISTGFSNPLAGRAAWSGNSGTFIATLVNLPAAANGQSIVLRFRRGTDSSLQAAAPSGQWIDTISITQPCPNICRGGGVTDCNDHSACTTDSCDPATGCHNDPIVCNDNNPCTTDTCNPATGCVFTPVNCDDGNACTLDACDPTTGVCTHVLIVCNDNNACTDDTCNPATGCVYTPNTNPCNDGSLCTTNDRCTNGACVGQTINCSDGNACTTDGCDPLGGCTHTTIDCNDHNKCTNDSCNPTSGCVNTPIVCDDGNSCTIDTCDLSGGCVYTTRNCNDNNACTNDSCNRTTGCVNAPVVCDDGNACTNDTCDPASGCTTTARDCNDHNKCTNDSCNPATGCVNATVSCDDGNACTTDACDPASGCTHTTLNCNDHNKCTNDSCNPTTGCVTSPVNCDDGNACTDDACDPAFGCSHTAVTCNDSNPCTNDSCNPTTGCVFAPNNAACNDGNACTTGDTCSGGSCQSGSATNCNDANPCTTDSCDPGSGCTHAPNPGAVCNDGNACTSGDACNTAGQCQGGAAVVCNDNNACTADSCNTSTGCVSTPTPGVACNDGNACTTGDACNAAGQCASGSPLVCNDNNPCTADSCNPSTGCVTTPTPGAACSDGNACTTNDACSTAGQCQGGAPLNCDDGNTCTNDACNPSSGCTHNPVPAGTACNDGNVCTTTDTCNAAGQCQGSGGASCDDGNPCTVDTCVAPSGCTHTPAPVGTACSDGNACTAGDTCVAGGTCHGGGTLNCDDGNACTADGCNPASGCTHAATPGAPCSDGNSCTTNDACTAAGTCQGGTPASCDDGNPCTTDGCTPAGGCTHTPNTGAACNDGNACTTSDSCTSTGTCHGSGTLNCDDHNSCTTDTCNPTTGCVHTGGGDSDGDGITDCDDTCPHSIPSSTVVIDNCNTGVTNYQTNGVQICGFDNHCGHHNEDDFLYDEHGGRTCSHPRQIGGHGCNVADLIEICRQIANCPSKWADCVEKVTKELKNQHILTEKQRNKIRKCVDRAIHGGRGPHSTSHTRHQDENRP